MADFGELTLGWFLPIIDWSAGLILDQVAFVCGAQACQSEAEKIDFTPIEIPQVRRSPWGFVKIALVLLLIGGGGGAWQMGYLPS